MPLLYCKALMPLLAAHHCMQISTSMLCLTFSSILFWRWKH